jgi:hypothetical protein
VKLWKEGENQRSRIATIIKETWENSSGFTAFFVVFVYRSCNPVTHTLAKQVSSENRLGEWQLAR